METLLIVLLILIGLAVMTVVLIYSRYQSAHNTLVALDARCDTAFADIDVQLKHRHNLIPGLVSVVKGMKDHEKDMILSVIEARNKALGTMSQDIRLQAEGHLTATLDTMLSSCDQYPEIRALPEFQNLRRELTDCENQLTAARRFFNLAVEEYNTELRSFPASKVAGKLRLSRRQPFDIGFERTLIDEPMVLQF